MSDVAKYNIPSILPSAFYHLASLNISDDWDKTRIIPDDGSPVELGRTQRTARWSLLSVEDWLCYERDKHAMNLRGPHVYSTACPRNPPCNTLITGINITIPPLEELENPLHYMCDIVMQYEEGTGTKCCSKCVHWLLSVIEGAKQELWEELKEWFELPAIGV